MSAGTIEQPIDASLAPPAEPPAHVAARELSSRLASAWVAFALGVITAAIQWQIWGSLNQTPSVTDEASYVLQARIFAHFHWAAPPPPIREFFEQAHVLMSPVIASKYPPGHALLLTLGVWLGMPGLVPVLLSGLTAGLLFAITRRLTNGHTALLAWFLWTFAPVAPGFRPSYFSESTTAATWVIGGWALLRWHADQRLRWLVLLAAATAWCAITRPVTAVPYAIPMAAAALALVWRRGAWRQASIALIAGCVVFAIMPLCNWRTLGTPGHTPYLVYNQTYNPYEHFGFGDNGGRPPTWLPPDSYWQFVPYVALHSRYTVAALPHEMRERLQWIWTDSFGGAPWSTAFGLFIPLGLLALGIEGLVAAACVVGLIITYMFYAHPAIWALYYYESLAPLCLLAAAGFTYAIGRLRRSGSFERNAVLGAVLVSLPFALATAGHIRIGRAGLSASQTVFARGAMHLPHPAMVFVRYGPKHLFYQSLINNDPDLAHAAVWTVNDLGDAENARLRAAAPLRHAFLFDEAAGMFFDLDKASTR